MGSFRESFEAYGADYQTTMGRFMGNEKMYLRILDMLFEDENLNKLGYALESEDMTGAFEAAHTLKGVVGNLGLTPLYEALCAIVEPLRFGRVCNYAAMYQDIQSEFGKVDILREHLKGGD